MPYLGIFGLEFSKSIVIFKIITLKLVIGESLTRTVNCGIGSTFSKGPDLGPLYKVCPSLDPTSALHQIHFHVGRTLQALLA